MVSSVTTRGALLVGLLAAALSQGCVRFGAAVVGGDGAVVDVDVFEAPAVDSLDVAALDASAASDAPDVPAADLPATDVPAPDVPAADVPATDVPATDVPAVDAPSGCVQNDDCADPRRPLCDVATGRCVGCLSSPDTCPLRRFCDTTTETCQDGCLDDRDCAPMGNADAGGLPRRCDVVRHTCGDCVSDSDCPPGAACVGGACAAGCAAGRPCAAGLDCCDGACVDVRTSAMHCGGCGVRCDLLHSNPVCAAGACAVGTCLSVFADCDGRADNGCEADLAGDGRHCGACGRACAAGQVCATGACRAVCAGTQTACGTSCADLSLDVANCGVCGRRCGGGQVCALGACQLDCASIGETLCAGACARTNSDPFHCGRCGNRCAAGPGATAVCVGGGCGLVCATGLGDCDGSAATGCEASLTSDLRNCGACGRACATANASAACSAGRCAIVRCDVGYGDCDGDPGNGCETALGADGRHCGACGVVCGGGTVCANGACAPRPGTTVISGPTVVNTVRAAVNGAAGSTTLRLGEGVGAFTAGSRVLIHQTQSRAGDAGRYELRRVIAVGSGALTLAAPLGRGYTTDPAAGARAQAVMVQSYMDLYVAAGGVLSAPAWDGRFGGVLAVDVAGDAVIEGQVSMDGRGFRGSARACTAGLYRCRSGAAGESLLGFGTAGRAANGGGGGGGGSGADCAAGGGGAYGGAGGPGTNGDCNGEPGGGMCSTGCPNPGGNGGAPYGGADLGAEMQLGSAGGEGGGDEDGETPGGGGNGGGAVWLRAGRTLEVPGSVTAGGSAGLDGNQSACGVGEGCGMGGGGGGSGGAVRLAAATRATLGADRVRAAGGGGGVCSCARIDRPGRSFPGGRGGAGRVGVASARVEGSTSPAYDPR